MPDRKARFLLKEVVKMMKASRELMRKNRRLKHRLLGMFFHKKLTPQGHRLLRETPRQGGVAYR